ncbi:hypothetical protein AMAG_00932 [Allomyces macrogynus ATCC 38327]|uniref:WW domain-containing protein n=1 Tax=Allomyces macrogynus (strain ATCC 38327) TaxID=578462 RepID=A0A0L0RXY4_ALLM3|nr:hypothetical protein AMAG_00932 [Allomyces macrogynus ATCC 38327]|eukprot:KNE54995.1 hypothetical protein AMAG_00932 [Allomyces macrogynus ATCC 38327]
MSSTGPASPPANPTIQVPDHGWTVHVAPTGHLYAFNHWTKKCTWRLPLVRPEAPFVPLPPPVNKYRLRVLPTEKAVSKKRLGNSPVYVVYTDAGNQFYYNKKTKRSTWRLTPDLVPLLEQVEKADKKGKEDKDEAEGDATEAKPDQDAVEKGEEDGEERPAKRAKIDATPVVESKPELLPVQDEPMDEDMAWQLQQLEAMADLDDSVDPTTTDPQPLIGDDDEDDEDIIHEPTVAEKSDLFYAHLVETQPSPFAPWDSINSALPDLDLDESVKKDLFEKYCEQRAAELRAAKQRPTNDPRANFVALVHANRKLFWSRKHRRDPRFTNYGVNDKEREKLWRDAKKTKPGTSTTPTPSSSTADRAARTQAALQARAAAAAADHASLRRETAASRARAACDNASAVLATLLAEHVRDLSVTKTEAVVGVIARDPRFVAAGVRAHLPPADLASAVREHVGTVAERAMAAFARCVRDDVPLGMRWADARSAVLATETGRAARAACVGREGGDDVRGDAALALAYAGLMRSRVDEGKRAVAEMVKGSPAVARWMAMFVP